MAEQSLANEMKEDPMDLMRRLRSHLIVASQKRLPNTEVQILERMKMADMLHEYSLSYRELLNIVSTPFPMALTQMGRTFIFVWTFSIPFILAGGLVDNWSAFTFVILLTYGFLGLEFVAMKMSNPFGDDGLNDLNVRAIAKATIQGIENDWKMSEIDSGGANAVPERTMMSAVSTQTLHAYENNTLKTDNDIGVLTMKDDMGASAYYSLCDCAGEGLT